MFDPDIEKAARKALIGTIKAGDSVEVVRGPLGPVYTNPRQKQDQGVCGIVQSITDDGVAVSALVRFRHRPGTWVEHTVRIENLAKKWPGLSRGENPIGGWKKLLDKQESRHPQPAVGQAVQNKGNGAWGVVLNLEGGMVGYEVAYRDTYLPPPGILSRTEWALPSDLKVQTYNEGHIEHWSDYACDVLAEAATPILDLPHPFCNIRRITESGKWEGRWSVRDENMAFIAVVDEKTAHELSIQLFWEFGLKTISSQPG